MGGLSDAIKEIYRKNMDNRILNNLRIQINEMVEDTRGVFSISDFKKLWFMYFKGEEHAGTIYDMVLPFLCVADDGDGKLIDLDDKAYRNPPSGTTVMLSA